MIEVRVERLYRLENNGKLKAFADIAINDSLLIKGLKVLSGQHGEFVTMPQEKNSSDNKWYDLVRCMSQNVKEQISDIVLYAYHNK